MMIEQYVASTNYFHNAWTWIFRGLRFLGAVVVLYLVDLRELENDSNILTGGFVFIGLLAIFFLVFPTDELATDNANLYFLRRSLIPFFNRSKVYKISDVQRIGSYNMLKPTGILALCVPIFNLHRVEMMFKDNSSISEDLIIRKKDLKRIVSQVKLSV